MISVQAVSAQEVSASVQVVSVETADVVWTW